MLTGDLLGIDVAALRTLTVVFRLGSFTDAAAEIGANQSTISYTIDKLRRAFNDPLFIRQGAGIAPTDRCREIVDAVGHVLSELENLSIASAFDPANASGKVTISSNFYSRMTFLGDVIRRIRSEAPGLEIVMAAEFVVGDLLRSGEVDVSLTPVPHDEKGLHIKPVLSDYAVCLMDKNNPLAKVDLDFETYSQVKHARVGFGANVRSVFHREAEARGIKLSRTITLPDPAALPNLITGTDLVATMPSRFGEIFNNALAVRRVPLDWPLHIYMVWAARSHLSPMNIWLREIIAEAAASIGPPREY